MTPEQTLDWLAEQHFDQCREERPIQDWIRKMKMMLPENSATLDSTGTTAVDRNYFWQPLSTCPRGAKVQLLGKGGVAMYGTYTGKETFYTHWAPLPKLSKETV